MTKESNKAWLSPDASPTWVETHIDGASKILNRGFKHSSSEAYDVMFDLGYIRLQFDGYDLFFNFSGQTPNSKQLEWLKSVALEDHYILFNGDTKKEVDLEAQGYGEVEVADDGVGKRFESNDGNQAFQKLQ